jgi:3-oxoadipyl-CoA thiolase
MKEAFITEGVRSPVASFGGGLSGIRADDLAAHSIRSLMKRLPQLEANAIDDVILGCANQAGEDNRNVARMALLLAGLPVGVPGETVNRLCASGLSAVVHAARAIEVGEADLVIAGGVEHMTRSPWVISKTSTAFGRDAEMFDTSFGWRFVNKKLKDLYGTDAMGETAENLADMYKISREDQDLFAFLSQKKAAQARTSGRLAMEIEPVLIPQKKGEPVAFEWDEFIKPETSPEILSRLRPAFRPTGGTVTAGNASGLNDGSAAMLLASEKACSYWNLKPKARIISSAVAGTEPRIMGIGPVEASKKAMARAGIGPDDLDIIEINEAFAAQVLACLRNMGIADDDPRVNVNGGAIALGHPLGMSGARIAYSAALELDLRQKKYALVTMCIGVGQGYAAILERV